MQIQTFAKEGFQLMRPKVANFVRLCKWCELFVAIFQGPLRDPGSLEFLVLKYTFSHILQTIFLLFLTFGWVVKIDKGSTLFFN